MQDKNAEYDSRTAEKFVIRLKDGQREAVAEVAKAAGRSMNSQMQLFIAEGLERADLEFKTDHSWTPQVGMMVNAKVGGKIRRAEIGAFKFYDYVTVRCLDNGYCDDVHLDDVRPYCRSL